MNKMTVFVSNCHNVLDLIKFDILVSGFPDNVLTNILPFSTRYVKTNIYDYLNHIPVVTKTFEYVLE